MASSSHPGRGGGLVLPHSFFVGTICGTKNRGCRVLARGDDVRVRSRAARLVQGGTVEVKGGYVEGCEGCEGAIP